MTPTLSGSEGGRAEARRPPRPSDFLCVVCFDPRELEALASCMTVQGEEAIPGSRFPLLRGLIDGERAGVLRLPFGDDPDLLLEIARGMIETARPTGIVAVGTAMACDAAFEPGDIAVVTRAGYEGRAAEFGGWLSEAALLGASHDQQIRTARSLTVRRFVGSEQDREELLCRWGPAEVVEMEDFHLASLASHHGVPYASLRTVTDRGSFDDHLAECRSAAERGVRQLRRTLRQMRMGRRLSSVDNPPTRNIPFRIVVRTEPGPLSLPEAAALARRAVGALGLVGVLPRSCRLDLEVPATGEALHPPAAPAVPSGLARVACEPGSWTLAWDEDNGHAALAIARPYLDALETGRGGGEGLESRLRRSARVRVPTPPPLPRHAPLPCTGGFHIQGLNSLSAEPEEGLLAATTVDEFRESRMQVGDSSACTTWIYRSANASHGSYFEPDYDVPMRRSREIPPGTYLIATGLGPAVDPAAGGGADASTLVLGDEQGGRLLQYLDDLTSSPFTEEDVFRYPGIAQRLDERTVALSRLDRRFILTAEGMSGLHYSAETLRQVYSTDYDRYLRGYFAASEKRSSRAKASHLLLTSRGCGYHCSFCCSGGMQPFAPLPEDTFVSLLRNIREREQPGPDEHVEIYLTDSYFNRNPDRVVRLVDRLEEEDLLRGFAFYVRHNGLQAFVTRRANGPGSLPVVHERLVDAYARLGIGEIVIGVDAYTDQSIRMLKTNFNQVALKGEETRPIYTFADIRAVLSAIEARGLSSRCFLLLQNPFVSDADRLQTFYNLVELALEIPGFTVDTESSDRVNELQPFAGAPLTRVAELIPGLVRDGKFHYASPVGRLEHHLDLRAFRSPRRDPAALLAFVARTQESRIRVAEALADRIRSTPRSGDARSSLADLLRAFLAAEERLAPALAVHTSDREALEAAEACVAAFVKAMSLSAVLSEPPQDAPEQKLYSLLRSPEVRDILGHPPRRRKGETPQ